MTIKMQCGDLFADVYDTPEDIRNAELQGFHRVKLEEKKPVEKKPTKKDK